MSQVNRVIMTGLLLIALVLSVAACGTSTPNENASFNAQSQQHAADWLPAAHMTAAQNNISSCAECHGEDFAGGISRVSCSKCHLGGADSIHPKDWAQEQIWKNHATYTGGLGTDACQNTACHGADLSGVAESGPSCTACHLGGVKSKHPQDWGQHAAALHSDYTMSNGGAKCANAACHGTTLVGTAGSGPACSICHAPPPHEVTDERTAGCSTCHDHATTAKMFHPWVAPTPLNHPAYVTANGNVSCAIAACHGTNLTGGENCPSCTSCHLGGLTSFHPQEWGAAIITAHQTYVNTNTTKGCANAACHGTDLLAGPGSTGPSCTTCHLGGVVTAHPVDFGGTPALNHSAFVAANGTVGCATAACHGVDLNGGTAGPSCSRCHLGGATSKHPASFGTTTRQVDLNHKAYVDANGSDGCKNAYCHGTTMTGVIGSGPACSTTACHQRGYPVLGNTPTLTNCASCHDKPPTGAIAPNRSGAHAAHNALPEVTNVCNTCHNGAGTNTLKHFDGAVDTAFLSAFNAKSGTAVRNSNGTCSNISCHGGQTTPLWLTGTINVNTECTICHSVGTSAGTPENNSYYSGKHVFHTTSIEIDCFACHDPAKLVQSHFTSLSTAIMEGPASGTLLDTNITSYDAGTKSCDASCHPGERFWLP